MWRLSPSTTRIFETLDCCSHVSPSLLRHMSTQGLHPLDRVFVVNLELYPTLTVPHVWTTHSEQAYYLQVRSACLRTTFFTNKTMSLACHLNSTYFVYSDNSVLHRHLLISRYVQCNLSKWPSLLVPHTLMHSWGPSIYTSSIDNTSVCIVHLSTTSCRVWQPQRIVHPWRLWLYHLSTDYVIVFIYVFDGPGCLPQQPPWCVFVNPMAHRCAHIICATVSTLATSSALHWGLIDIFSSHNIHDASTVMTRVILTCQLLIQSHHLQHSPCDCRRC